MELFNPGPVAVSLVSWALADNARRDDIPFSTLAPGGCLVIAAIAAGFAAHYRILTWGQGQVTATIAAGQTWGGGWLSLNHQIAERLPINFAAILPAQIRQPYQSQVSGITARIVRGTPGRTFRLELKDGGALRWTRQVALEGRAQVVSFDLPAIGSANELVWVLDDGAGGDFVVLDSISFTGTTRITDTATAAFVWSYGMLLNNWNPNTGLVRDKAREASGTFDAVQATGSLAAATAIAEQLDIISRADAIQIVEGISDTLLKDLPRFHGLWPHWVSVSADGTFRPAPHSEWSSVDTVIAAIGLLAAQQALGLETGGAEELLRGIDWQDLVKLDEISMGYSCADGPCPVWNVFGTETWLVELAYASVTGDVATIRDPLPPTANGSGFIDELAWLFVPPPAAPDYWGVDWPDYRRVAADRQIRYFCANYPDSCFAQRRLFGLSAVEALDPRQTPTASFYRSFGVGGRVPAADGSASLGAPLTAPHYSALIASLRPQDAIRMWDWLMQGGQITPLNNTESLMFPAGATCDPVGVVVNHLKGSWNLSLQTLGWGRYLAESRGEVPVLWQAATANALLRRGYRLLVPAQ